jgi:glutamyl-tRNA synthetase
MDVTHIIRGKEHYTNMIRQKYMYNHLGWKYAEAIHYGRLKITGAFLSKSKIIQGVKDGTYSGYDDPRLGTFAALRKRGITPEAIKKMIIDVGTKPNDVTLSWDTLYAYNRKILDAASSRYFFVPDPVELKVLGAPKVFRPKLSLHPDQAEFGFREYTVTPEGNERAISFWVARKDSEAMEKDNVIRLMGLFNVRVKDKTSSAMTATFASESYEDARKIKAPLIQWILKGEEFPCKVIMPDASVTDGFAESACKNLKPDAIIQFERFGFTRVDEVNQKLITYYAHK